MYKKTLQHWNTRRRLLLQYIVWQEGNGRFISPLYPKGKSVVTAEDERTYHATKLERTELEKAVQRGYYLPWQVPRMMARDIDQFVNIHIVTNIMVCSKKELTQYLLDPKVGIRLWAEHRLQSLR